MFLRLVALIVLYCQCQGKILDLDEDVSKLSAGNVEFSINLYKKLVEDPKAENILFSPLSVSVAMAMTQLGAKGNTAKQIEETFQFDKLEGKLHSAFGELHGLLLDKSSENVTIRSSNRVFADSTMQLLEDYKNALTVYGAKVQTINFAKAAEAISAINEWISEATEGKITKAIDEVDSNVVMVIANAVYFRADWHAAFSKTQTEQRGFYVSHYKVVKTPFMFQRGQFRYAYVESLTLQVLELPYAGQDYSMVILLPENFDLATVERNLNPGNLTKWLSALEYASVDLTLPKFKLEETLSLHQILPKLGVTDVFDQTKSDLSGMGKAKNGQNHYVDQILHKAAIEVDEEGSVAAAATTVRITTRSAVLRHRFHADHPFLWTIKEKSTGLFVFMGRLSRPEGPVANHDEF